MAKPFIHAKTSKQVFGGEVEDYIEIHQFLDSSKMAIADNRHRALTHNAWFLSVVLERCFGVTIRNSNGREISVREIGERHVLEDYHMKFIPTAQDFIKTMNIEEWMYNSSMVKTETNYDSIIYDTEDSELSYLNFSDICSRFSMIYDFIESPRNICSDFRYRMLTYNSWFLNTVLTKAFGKTVVDPTYGQPISTITLGKYFILYYYVSVPTAQDWIQTISFQTWMDNAAKGSFPESYQTITNTTNKNQP